MGRIDKTFYGELNESDFRERYKKVLKGITRILRCDVQSFIEKEREYFGGRIQSKSGRGEENIFFEGIRLLFGRRSVRVLKGLAAAMWKEISPCFEWIGGCRLGEDQFAF